MSMHCSADALNPHTASTAETACFCVVAAAEPGVLERVLELFAKRGLVPARLHGQVEVELTVDIQVRDLPAREAEYIARCMRQIHRVERVFVSRLERA